MLNRILYILRLLSILDHFKIHIMLECFLLPKKFFVPSCFMEQVFAKGVDKDTVVLMAARASRLENQDAIDTAIVSMLSDPKEVLALTC